MNILGSKLLGSTLIVAALVGVPPSAMGASVLSAEDVRQNLFSTCFVSETEGWAVGDLGRIFHTTDGARTWERQDAGTQRPFAHVSCPSRDHVWIGGQAGQVAHSTDQGKTWKMVDAGTDRQILALEFPTPELGIAVGDYGMVVRTEDGGKSWTRVPLPEELYLPEDIAEIIAPGDVVLYSLTFNDPNNLWIAGEFGTVLRSRDGGRSWTAQPTPIETSLFGVDFADTQRGWAVGMEATMLVTSDGGETWTRKKVETPPGFALSLYDVHVEGQFGWAIGNSGFLLQTTDGGTSWSLVDVPVQMGSIWFRGITLDEGAHGFIVGARGLVLEVSGDKFTPRKKKY